MLEASIDLCHTLIYKNKYIALGTSGGQLNTSNFFESWFTTVRTCIWHILQNNCKRETLRDVDTNCIWIYIYG